MLFLMAKRAVQGKVVLLTGGARGIGKEIAYRFLKEGALVVINDIDAAELRLTRKEFGFKGFAVKTVCADLTQEVECKRLIKAVIKKYGHLDILINNAGKGFRGLFEQTTLEVFHTIMKTNLNTAVNCTSAALPELKRSKGSIVFLSSVAAVRGLPAYGPYSVSKIALKSFAQLLRTELHTMGVHVGVLLIGPVKPDEGKRIMIHDGSNSPVRNVGILVSKRKIADAVLSMVKHRKFMRRVNIMTTIIEVLHRLFPWLLEKLLVRMSDPRHYK